MLFAGSDAAARRTPRAEEVPERERYVIRPDREATARELIADPGFFVPLEGGVIFDSISLERSRVVYRLHRVGHSEEAPLGTLELGPAPLAGLGERTSKSFSLRISRAVDDPDVSKALEAAARSVAAHDDGEFFAYLGRPVRIGLLEVLGVAPFHPHSVLVALALIGFALGLALSRRTPGPRVTFELKLTHLLPSILQFLLYAYWGLYWFGVRQHLPLLVLQIAWAFLFDGAFCLVRYRRWKAGFGPLPITLSTNLFMQFPVESLYLSLTALSCALASRHLLRRADGSHLFNPSALGIACVGLANLLRPSLGDGDVSMELALPPNMTELMLLLALIVQVRMRITLIAISAALALLAFSRVTGFTYFQPFWPPVFLVLTLVAGDPATSPRTGTGRVLYGLLLGLLMGTAAALLEENGLSDFYGKIIPVCLVNLAVPLLDRLAQRIPAPFAGLFDPRGNWGHLALWVALVVTGMRSKVIAPELHAYYQTRLTRPGPDGRISCESSPHFCRPFSFVDEARAWLRR